ncbi:hypothetical protein NN561_013751 [Cricetulus griseus]
MPRSSRCVSAVGRLLQNRTLGKHTRVCLAGFDWRRPRPRQPLPRTSLRYPRGPRPGHPRPAAARALPTPAKLGNRLANLGPSWGVGVDFGSVAGCPPPRAAALEESAARRGPGASRPAGRGEGRLRDAEPRARTLFRLRRSASAPGCSGSRSARPSSVSPAQRQGGSPGTQTEDREARTPGRKLRTAGGKKFLRAACLVPAQTAACGQGFLPLS